MLSIGKYNIFWIYDIDIPMSTISDPLRSILCGAILILMQSIDSENISILNFISSTNLNCYSDKII